MLPGRSRISRSNMSIAALCTFLPDSQRETVLAPESQLLRQFRLSQLELFADRANVVRRQ